MLGLDAVSIDDNFFDLGGHSLLATRLVSRIRVVLGVECAIRTLFEAPTVAGVTAKLAQAQEAARAPLQAQARPPRLPLSYAQRRLWFLDRLEGPGPTYNMPLALRLRGALDAGAMEEALRFAVGRHESLRTLFVDADGMPSQQVLDVTDPRAGLVLEQVEANEATLPGLLQDAARRAFRLEAEIPLRATLFRLSAEEHVLLVVAHHIASDGWSMAPLARDLGAAYAAAVRNETPALAPLPVQYGDYTLWQRELLGEESDLESLLSRQASYWRERLSGLPGCIALPTDRPRPLVSSYRGERVPLRIEPALHAGLRGLARRTGSSLFMVMQAALAVLLGRLGAGEDIAIGSPIAGRTDNALDDLVGFFVNTLVVRTDLSGDPTVEALIGRVREASLGAYAHQDLPFERLVELVNPERSQNHHPLFQVMLALQNNVVPDLALSDLAVSVESGTASVAKFDLTFALAETGEGLVGGIEYATDLFDAASIERLGARLTRVLAAFAADATQPVGAIDLLTDAERHRVLVQWNDTAHDVPEATLPELFEAQVGKSPEATAVVFEEERLSYAELNARANRLAHHLIGMGIGPEERVALCLERSPAMVVTLLAILKAGAAYVPLDPDYPSERLAFMLKDARPKAVVTTTLLADGDLLASAATPLVRLDSADVVDALAQAPATDPTDADRAAALLPHHPAYVIYTSGSTGTPKGVVVSHQNLTAYLLWSNDSYYRTTGSGSPTVHSIAFDGLVTTLYGPLLAGQALHILPAGEEVTRLVGNKAVGSYTLIKATPSHLALINQELEALPAGASPTLALMVGGEALIPSDLAFWQRNFPEVRLIRR